MRHSAILTCEEAKTMSSINPLSYLSQPHFTGFLLGCALALILALVVIIHARNILNQPGKAVYMETMFPLYR